MDHDNCPLTFSKALLNIIGGKGAISNINYYYLINITLSMEDNREVVLEIEIVLASCFLAFQYHLSISR